VRIRLVVATALTGVLAAPAIAPTIASAAPGPVTPMIIGGGAAAASPWAVAVFATAKDVTRFGCTGTVISAGWVLTAKHCIVDGAVMSVRIGSATYASGGVTRSIASTSTKDDLALMKLDAPVTTTYVPLSGAYPPVGYSNDIYGWGRTCETCDFSATLKTATVKVLSTRSQYIAGGRGILSDKGTGSAWSGDSGGPQIYQGKQVGVSSLADIRSGQQVATSIAYHRAWISRISGVAISS
jgi:secreted trypsin-like serine protease